MSDLFLTSGYSLTHPSGGPTFGVHRPELAYEKGLPVAAGLIMRETLISVIISMAKVLGGAS